MASSFLDSFWASEKGTENTIKTCTLRDGNKNLTLLITGTVDVGKKLSLNLGEKYPILIECASLRIDYVQHSLSRGLLASLSWVSEGGSDLFLPMEGKGVHDYGWLSGIHSPEECCGALILDLENEADKPKSFQLIIDFTRSK